MRGSRLGLSVLIASAKYKVLIASTKYKVLIARTKYKVLIKVDNNDNYITTFRRELSYTIQSSTNTVLHKYSPAQGTSTMSNSRGVASCLERPPYLLVFTKKYF